MTSNFLFLSTAWPDVFDSASKAESLVNADARASCFYTRRSLELIVHWLYKHDSKLRLPYKDDLSALLHEATFRTAVGNSVFNKAKLIKDLGNLAVHSSRPVRLVDAEQAIRELFHVCFWLARNYARGAKPADGVRFDNALVPKTVAMPAQTLDQLQRLEAQLRERDESLKAILKDKESLDAELVQARAEIAELKKASAATPDTHDYSEAQTRDYFIDLLIKEAGWALDQKRDREFEVAGMPNTQGKGFIDYVLWGDDDKPLALVEAKRTKRDPHQGQQQAKLYADCLEKQFGQRPVIFYSNGYEHWLWDDESYPPREVQGFYKKAELELMILRRASRKSLGKAEVNKRIVERYYQERCIRRIGSAFEADHLRRALVVMATGAGKTRTVIALCELLMKANWAKRVLFLCDRVALVNQAVRAFKSFLPEASPVNLCTEKNGEGRVYVSTYPTMMGLINDTSDGLRRFGVGHFDLVIIDEAHRSVYQKYGAIFDYFDSLLVGLTATPKDDIDHNTYGLFELEDGVPTDAYSLADAVGDKFLVPPKTISVPLRIQREGLTYAQLSEEEKEQWDELEWDDEEGTPDHVEAAAVNQWLFNKDTVDKVLEHLMTKGLHVAGGDRLGKTIIFAKNHDHAVYIVERFDANYPHLRGHFARVIDFKTEYAQSLIDDFSKPNKDPHIAVSVDMLDTGIDVPEVVNLVFFKLVRSKTKFWQMMGRGTRLCPDLFGPDADKQFFYVFDYCRNLEFFGQNPNFENGSSGESLGKRLFTARLELIGELDRCAAPAAGLQEPTKLMDLRGETAAMLRDEVAAMKLENFVVRPHRRLVERFGKAEAWEQLSADAMRELAGEVAGLPSELPAEDEEAKRFDLLMLRTQLALLRHESSLEKLRAQVKLLAALLEENSRVPAILAHLDLIQTIQSEEWWQDVTPQMIEHVRRKLRSLMQLIEKKKRKPVYSDFKDELGEGVEVQLAELTTAADFERFREKARHFLLQHEDHITIHKLRTNEPLTKLDLEELERMLAESGVASHADLAKAKKESAGLGLFVRSLVGLDRESAKKVLGEFLHHKTLGAHQIEFINLIVDHLTEQGVMDAALLYESPFIDANPLGVDGLFDAGEVTQIIDALELVRQRAVA